MKLEIVKKCGRPKRLPVIKVWFVGRVYRMRRKFGNRRVEFRDPGDLMDRPSSIKNELAISGLTILSIYHLMTNLEIIIAVTSMTYIIDLNA